MKVMILAGGRGSRMNEATTLRPKPLVTIGGRPILWHVMMIYSRFGYNDFVIGLGYRGDDIRRYFREYAGQSVTESVRRESEQIEVCDATEHPPWNVQLIETGDQTQTGGRVKRMASHLNDETFMLTYADGVADIDIDELVRFHQSHGNLASVTAVHPPARYGHLNLDGHMVEEFNEKPARTEEWINGAFFVLEPEIVDYIDGDSSVLESDALSKLAHDRQLMAFKHEGFWLAMDTMKEREALEELWQSSECPWAARSLQV